MGKTREQEREEEREEEPRRLAEAKRLEWDTESSTGMSFRRGASSWWYLVPLIFGLLGGVIMYAALRHEDEDAAFGGLLLGIGITVVGFLLLWWTGWLF